MATRKEDDSYDVIRCKTTIGIVELKLPVGYSHDNVRISLVEDDDGIEMMLIDFRNRCVEE